MLTDKISKLKWQRKRQRGVLCCCWVTKFMSNSFMTSWTVAHQAPLSMGFPGKNTGVGCQFLLQCMKVKSESEVAQSWPTLSDPMDRSPPSSSVHGIFQARILEWVAISFSWGSSQPRDRTHVSCIGRWVLYCWASREARQRGVTLAKHDIQHTHFVRLSLNCQKVKSMWRGESRKFYLEDIVNGLYLILWPGLHCFRWALTSSGLRSSPFTLGTA